MFAGSSRPPLRIRLIIRAITCRTLRSPRGATPPHPFDITKVIEKGKSYVGKMDAILTDPHLDARIKICIID